MENDANSPVTDELQDRLIVLLREKSVVRGEETKLSSGGTSDFYVDARQTTLHAEGAWVVAHMILQRLRADVSAIGGPTLGADPIACSTAAISYAQGRPLHAFLIRKEPKGHGKGEVVEGMANLAAGTKVAIVEDTTTSGKSLIRAANMAKEAGLHVVQCLVIVDREEGAAEALAEAGYALECLTTRSDLDW